MRIFLRTFLLLFFSSLSFAQQEPEYLAEHLAMGNPSNAQKDIRQATNYLMAKKQYVLSYHRFNGIANWVAWHTDSTWLGDVKRSDNFRADSTLPEKWYRVHEKSYRRSGYDRGHLCPSGDRTNTSYDNAMTFLMTNIIPQVANNNRGPWAELESYCRDLVRLGKEIYIYCGGVGSKGFLDSGRVNIPEKTWKVILVLEAGENDLQRITDSTRTIAVVMPNDNALIGMYDDWKKFRVSVDDVEELTKLDFFKNVPKHLQKKIESVIDAQ